MTIGIGAAETCVRCGAPAHKRVLRRKLLDSPRDVFPVCLSCGPDVLWDLLAETPPWLKKITRFWALPANAARNPQ